jgi:hypothetical protein
VRRVEQPALDPPGAIGGGLIGVAESYVSTVISQGIVAKVSGAARHTRCSARSRSAWNSSSCGPSRWASRCFRRRQQMFERLLAQPVGFFTHRRAGDVVSRLNTVVDDG